MPFVVCDASQLEWRVAVELSRDEIALTELFNKDDIHSLNQVAFELPSRLISKIYLFRTIFRGSGWAFANDNEFSHVSSSPKFWDNVNEKFYTKYNGLDRKHHEWKDLVLAKQPITGPLGRMWTVPMQKDRTGGIKIPWTTLSNYPVQGTGADIMALARVSFVRRIKALNIPCRFISTVHDSIVVDVPLEFVQTVVDIFYAVFNDLQANIWKLFKYEWYTPLACECKVGNNLKDMSKVSPSVLL